MIIKNTDKNIVAKINKKFNSRNVLTFLFFVVISSILWVFNALNKDYTTNIKFRIAFSNIPANILPDNKNQEIIVNIKGNGYTLIEEKFNNYNIPFYINFENKENVIIHSIPGTPKKYIITSELIPFITKKFSNQITIEDISPDTIFFKDIRGYSKLVPIKPNLNIKTTNNNYYFISEIKIIPDSVRIYGNKKILDTINSIYTESKDVNLNKINNIFEVKLLDNFDNKINISKKKAIVNVIVNEYTEKKCRLNIKPVNFPNNFKVTFLPSEIDIICKVPLSEYDKVNPENFDVTADYNNRRNDIVPVKVISKNKNIIVTRISHEFVNFILEKNK